MITFTEALTRLAACSATALPVERIPVVTASGRVLAEPVAFIRDQPPFDRAAMDGYAVRADAPVPAGTCLPVIGTRHAGGDSPVPQVGQAIRIMTGAAVPAGCGVIPIERTDRGKSQVVLHHECRPGDHVARRGEDARAGDVVLRAGQRLSPVLTALAAMSGARDVAVYRAPRIMVITTGDEVHRQDSSDVSIADSNGPLVIALAAALGIAADIRHASDDRAALTTIVQASDADLIITTGGVSAGERDFVPMALSEAGATTIFHGVDIQPGKPVLIAQRMSNDRTQWIAGLPGNPVSVLATFHLFVLPLISRCWPEFAWPWTHTRLSHPMRNAPRHRFLSATLAADGATLVPTNGSGDLIAAAAGDGLVECAAGVDLAAGTAVRFLPFVGSTIGERGELPPRAR